MYFQVIETGDFMESFFQQAKHNALPEGSKLTNIDMNVDAGIPILKFTFLNFRQDVLDKYEKQIKESGSPLIIISPSWSDKIKAEEISELPKVTQPEDTEGE